MPSRVPYNGGSVSTNVKPDDWDNKLAVNSDSIIIALKDGQVVTIPPKQVTALLQQIPMRSLLHPLGKRIDGYHR